MTEATAERDLSKFSGKRVTIVRILKEPGENGEGAVELEGVVEVGNELGLLLKPKGKVQFELVPADEIDDIYLLPEAGKKFKATKLKHVEFGQARRHLLDRHSVNLEWANNVSEEQAMEFHASLDHEELKLGHVHVDKKPKPEEGESEDS
jgi:hypothetical protein